MEQFSENLEINKFLKSKPFHQKFLKVWGENKVEHSFVVRNVLNVEHSLCRCPLYCKY